MNLNEGATMAHQLMTYKDLSEWLRLDPATISHMVSRKEIPHIRLGPRSVRFIESEIKEWIEFQRGAGLEHALLRDLK